MSGGWMVDLDEASQPGHDCRSDYSFDVQVSDGRVPFFYCPVSRTWGIPRLPEPLPAGWREWSPRCILRHCPWCGEAFPPPLLEDLVEALAAIGLVPGDPDTPEQYMSDKWWREAGL